MSPARNAQRLTQDVRWAEQRVGSEHRKQAEKEVEFAYKVVHEKNSIIFVTSFICSNLLIVALCNLSVVPGLQLILPIAMCRSLAKETLVIALVLFGYRFRLPSKFDVVFDATGWYKS